MPMVVNETRGKIQFATSAEMPWLIYQACLVTGTYSNTAYCQRALAEALSRDLGVPVETILDRIPTNKGPARHLFDPREGKQARHCREEVK